MYIYMYYILNPRRSRLVAYLTILYAISAHWPRQWPRAHITQVLAR